MPLPAGEMGHVHPDGRVVGEEGQSGAFNHFVGFAESGDDRRFVNQGEVGRALHEIVGRATVVAESRGVAVNPSVAHVDDDEVELPGEPVAVAQRPFRQHRDAGGVCGKAMIVGDDRQFALYAVVRVGDQLAVEEKVSGDAAPSAAFGGVADATVKRQVERRQFFALNGGDFGGGRGANRQRQGGDGGGFPAGEAGKGGGHRGQCPADEERQVKGRHEISDVKPIAAPARC